MIAGTPSNLEMFGSQTIQGITIYWPLDGIYQDDYILIDYGNHGHGPQLTVEGLITVPGITEYYSDKIKNKSRYLECNIKFAKH